MGTSAVGAEALDYLQEEVEWDKDIYPRWLEDPKIAHKEEAQLQPSVLSLGPTFHLKGSGPPPRQEHVCTPHSAWAVGKVLSWDFSRTCLPFHIPEVQDGGLQDWLLLRPLPFVLIQLSSVTILTLSSYKAPNHM